MCTSLKEHPTVEAHRKKPAPEKASQPLDAAWLRQLCLDAGDGYYEAVLAMPDGTRIEITA
ncbi:MAG: hypothetical protein EPO07_19460 [Verrucomicrobia bacterium]|nr:MAG: hypothetical protein EPO07_19460 [Verrucomicrobiota bacterium]